MQNELIHLIDVQLQVTIIRPFNSKIIDETTKLSVKTSFNYRLLCFYIVQTECGIKNLLSSKKLLIPQGRSCFSCFVKHLGLNMSKLVRLDFDTAANISRNVKGFQARISKKITTAQLCTGWMKRMKFIHCYIVFFHYHPFLLFSIT